MNAKNETKILPAGTVLVFCNAPGCPRGKVVAARFGRGRRLKGYDVRTKDGDLQLWRLGEFFRLYEVEVEGKKFLVSVPGEYEGA